MELLQNLALGIYKTFFNFSKPMDVADLPVDARDVGMVARYNRPLNPFDGWGFFIMETANKHHKAPDAFKITEDGYTRFEERLYADIQAFFRERTGIVVSRETIHQMELAATKFPDYYTRLSIACMEYEAKHAPNMVPIYPVVRTLN